MKKLTTQYYLVRISILMSTLFVGLTTYCQYATIGLLHVDDNVSEGYTLFTPKKNNNVYLINNCGEVINEWVFSERPGAVCYFLENGNLLRAGLDSLEIRDWNNNLLWSYAMNENGILQHHDIEPLPNGNILCVVSDKYSAAEIIEEGRDPSKVDESFKLDKIVELKPLGSNDAEIVWEWKIFDHLIQDFDSEKSNFGIVEDHPELIDINFETISNEDYTHVNAIDYNSELDQIIITVRSLSEIYIIDHSTTTEEAAGHSGGNSNRGGDLLWRWGNPQVYKQAGPYDQKLILPHDAKWVEPGYLDAGKISVFNNRGDTTNTFSSIHLLTPEFSDGTYLMENNMFLPDGFEWTWQGSILGKVFYEKNKSGTHALPNGNFIICESSVGRVSELTKTGDHLWTYRNPTGQIIYNQFDSIPQPENSIFRAEKYPVTFPGFAGLDLTPNGIIEDQNVISDTCIATAGITDINVNTITVVNPVQNKLIQFNQNVTLKAITISDLNGKVVFEQDYFNGINLKVDLVPAFYFLRFYFDKKLETRKIIVR